MTEVTETGRAFAAFLYTGWLALVALVVYARFREDGDNASRCANDPDDTLWNDTHPALSQCTHELDERGICRHCKLNVMDDIHWQAHG